MIKKLRRTFMVEQDVIPSQSKPQAVPKRTWPPGLAGVVDTAIKTNRYLREAHAQVWGRPEVFPPHLFPSERVEVWDRAGEPFLIASHVAQDDTIIGLAREWAQSMGLAFSFLERGASWLDADESAPTYIVLTFRRP